MESSLSYWLKSWTEGKCVGGLWGTVLYTFSFLPPSNQQYGKFKSNSWEKVQLSYEFGVCVPAYLPFPNSQRRKACLAGMISLIQQFLLFSRLTGKPSRSVSHGQATVHSLELLLRGNASSHGNSYTGPLNTRLKTAADRLQCVFREPSQTCNFKTFFLILQLGLGNEMKKIIGAK